MAAILAETGEDLEALFDSIADATRAGASAQAPAAAGAAASSGDAGGAGAAAAADGSAAPADPYPIFERIGHLTRNLHDALRELGYDKQVEHAVGTLPDARARLSYIARLTGEAAETALAKSEAGVELQATLGREAGQLAARWEQVFTGQLGVDEFRRHAESTRDFLRGVPARTAATSALFSDIILAQDFHDLTGQVVQKIVTMAEGLEAQLVKLLLDTTPPARRGEGETAWLNGPVIDTAGRDDVVRDQAQVDDLLASLGF